MKISINGQDYSFLEGGNVSIGSNRVIVNGKVISENIVGDVKVFVEGDVVNLDVAGDTIVNGSVKGDADITGDLKCLDITGDVDITGNIECGDIKGNVDIVGNIRKR